VGNNISVMGVSTLSALFRRRNDEMDDSVLVSASTWRSGHATKSRLRVQTNQLCEGA
jgi:hypothetical protein